jgi:hypothetical protein
MRFFLRFFFISALVACSTNPDSQNDPKKIDRDILELPVFGDNAPIAGNPNGGCAAPEEAQAESINNPDQIIGDGTPESCTSEAVVQAVAAGGVIVFNCGADPLVIPMEATAKIFNDASESIVIDGGGLVALSGQGERRILYMNTCDADQHWTTSHCQNQDHPKLSIQNITFIDGDSQSESEFDGGGAVWIRGGRVKLVNTRFFNNYCAPEGPDVGGAGIRVFSQYEGLPVYVVNSTFGGGAGYGNVCSNGGGISSIQVSWSIYNSVFSYNRAIGNGANPAQEGTPGGGSGGAIYNDGLTMRLEVCGTIISENEVNAHGSAIFFVTNNHDGDILIQDSEITGNIGGSWYAAPGISMHSDTRLEIVNSIVEE